MQRVAVGVEADDLKAASVKFGFERLLRIGLPEQVIHFAMRRCGPTAGVHLDAADPHALSVVHHFGE